MLRAGFPLAVRLLRAACRHYVICSAVHKSTRSRHELRAACMKGRVQYIGMIAVKSQVVSASAAVNRRTAKAELRRCRRVQKWQTCPANRSPTSPYRTMRSSYREPACSRTYVNDDVRGENVSNGLHCSTTCADFYRCFDQHDPGSTWYTFD